MASRKTATDPSKYFTVYESDLTGPLYLASDGTSLTQCRFEAETHPYDFDSLEENTDLPIFQQACLWLDRYFAGENPDPKELSLAPQGSPFQLRVWNEISKIPYGETVTYGTMAKNLGSAEYPTSPRAIGNATGRNGIVIIIPCHRVMGVNNNLTGFGGGIPAKTKLLQLEGIDTSKLQQPKISQRK